MAGRPEKFVGFRDFLETKLQELKVKPLKEARFEISFRKIAALGCPLPPSAYGHRGWWANNSSKVWYRVGFLIEKVDLQEQTVTFRRNFGKTPEELARLDEAMSGLFEAPASWKAPGSAKQQASHDKKPHPLFGAMKGTIRVAAGTDLTAPADPHWGKVYDK